MANPFIASKEYCDAIQKELSNPRWSRSSLSMEFETDPEFLREILPPCFDMPDEAVGSVSIGKKQMSFGGEYDAAAVSFRAKYKQFDKNATYTLALYISPDMPILMGREVWGEPKKEGIVQMYKCGTDIFAFAERNGTRLIELDGTLGENEGPQDGAVYYNLDMKCIPHGQGYGWQTNPVVLVQENYIHHHVMMKGEGKLTLRSGHFDSIGEIPVLKVGKLVYTESVTTTTIPVCDQLENPKQYLPYFYGAYYDNFDLARKGSVFNTF